MDSVTKLVDSSDSAKWREREKESHSEGKVQIEGERVRVSLCVERKKEVTVREKLTHLTEA